LRKIFFVPFFRKSVQEILAYIRRESPQNAEKFEKDLQKSMKDIASYPTVKSFPNKSRRYRFAVFKKNWKIYFKVFKEKLIFLGIIHVKQHPDKEKNIRKEK
jgi:plasmid stabilization system protein ParE